MNIDFMDKIPPEAMEKGMMAMVALMKELQELRIENQKLREKLRLVESSL
jgi:regulator of replication initiation timing